MKKSFLYKGLNFTIPPKTLEYAGYLLPFELFNHDIHKLDITNEKKDCEFFSLNYYNENSATLNLTSEEFVALKLPSKNKFLIIEKLDKGNSVAIIDKINYLEKVRNILSDSSKLSQVSVSKDKQWSFIVNVEKHITEVLKNIEI